MPSTMTGAADVWSRLAESVPTSAIKWRQDGRPVAQNGRHYARFVPYIDAQTVTDRLDSVCPGWTFATEALPTRPAPDGSGAVAYVRGSLTITRDDGLTTTRDGIGAGKDHKAAATDALKRAAVLFGIGRELYAVPQLWVPMDGDGKYAKPLRSPSEVYAEKIGAKTPPEPPASDPYVSKGEDPLGHFPDRPLSDDPPCPKCGGRMWDNRKSKRNPRAPDFKCRDRGCDGVIWPPKEEKPPAAPEPQDEEEYDDEIPF